MQLLEANVIYSRWIIPGVCIEFRLVCSTPGSIQRQGEGNSKVKKLRELNEIESEVRHSHDARVELKGGILCLKVREAGCCTTFKNASLQ